MMGFPLSPEAMAVALAPFSVRIIESAFVAEDEILFVSPSEAHVGPLALRRIRRTFRNPAAEAAWADQWWRHGDDRGWWES